MPTLIKQTHRPRLNAGGFVPQLKPHGREWIAPKTMNLKNVSDDAPHILVIDDDDRIRSLLQRYLSENGLRVTGAADASMARNFMEKLAFDLLVVDIMMPGEDGISLTRSVRDESDIPILMLTARSETSDRIEGLEIGADDYLAKPFEPRELLLRISSILKRYGPPPDANFELVSFGPFSFNLEKGELKRNDEPVKLTDREKEIMRMFCKAPGETVARHELLASPDATGERTVDVQINRLRRKIEVDPANPVYLHTVRGVGYRMITD